MAAIHGRVVDAAGAPVASAAVYVVSAPGPQPDIGQLTGPDGTFVLAARRPGTYVIGARADDAGEGHTQVQVAEASEDVRATITLVVGWRER